jgi:hypothetical protein
VTVAASRFPATARRALAGAGGEQAAAVLGSLHRICRVYAAVGIVVPVFGLATASSLGVLGDAWLLGAMVLTAAAAGVLGLLVLPGQGRILGPLQAGTGVEARAVTRLAMTTGVFNLLWVVVTVLMIVRPGSTTGASG